MIHVPNCHDIIETYLEVNGFDGLFNPGECACLKDDLAPCGDINLDYCEPGYRRQATDEDDSEFDWVIGRVKPPLTTGPESDMSEKTDERAADADNSD